MKTLKVPFAVGVAMLSVVALAAIWPQEALAQGNPFVGTWVLNVAKSKYTPGPPPKSQTVVWEAAGQGVKVSTTGVDATGKATAPTGYTSNLDGKDVAVAGNPDWDMTSLKRVDANTLAFTRKKSGKVVQEGTITVSKDGKTRTNVTTGVNAQGQKINNTAVYDRK
jgi:hypothetical protein